MSGIKSERFRLSSDLGRAGAAVAAFRDFAELRELCAATERVGLVSGQIEAAEFQELVTREQPLTH